MKPENKELLLQDLCARLPYGVIVHCKGEYQKFHEVEEIDVRDEVVRYFEGMHLHEESISNCFPYLRPMSSMTEEEEKEYTSYCFEQPFLQKGKTPNLGSIPMCIDWLNKNMFDFRGLIKKGLSIEVTEDNNPYKD